MTTSDVKVWSEEDIRALCNQETPTDAVVMALSCLQRITIALETIAKQGEPSTLFDGK